MSVPGTQRIRIAHLIGGPIWLAVGTLGPPLLGIATFPAYAAGVVNFTWDEFVAALLEAHAGVLRVARPQHRLCGVVLRPHFEDFRPSAQHDPAEPTPILVIPVRDEGRLRVFQDVAHPFQRPVLTFRLLVDRDVDGALGEHIAHRDHMRHALAVGRREMADPAIVEKPPLRIG